MSPTLNIETIPQLPKSIVWLLAVAVGVTAANLYYAQPLVTMIGQALALRPSAAGLVVTFTQIGYGLGVLLVVPLADIVENRRLILTMAFGTVGGLLGLSFATQTVPYFIAAFVTGLGASSVQVLVPYAAHFSPEHSRGQVAGRLTSGLMIGIMLSRPVASLLTDFYSWHAVFLLSTLLMVVLTVALRILLPPRLPASRNLQYAKLLSSMIDLLRTTPILRRRSIYQALMFGAFCLFWTAVPMQLAGKSFALSQKAIAVFALVGVAGAVAAPFAGLAADRGLSAPATAIAMILGIASFAISAVVQDGSGLALLCLVLAAILLDAGITANLVLGQRAIFALHPDFRGRLNGLYIAIIFVGGAAGSALGAWAFAQGGWALTARCGLLLPTVALAFFSTEALVSRRKLSA